MKKRSPFLRLLMLPALLGFAATSSDAAILFSFEQGDLRKDGVLYGSGATYSGTFDGSVSDQAPGGSASINTQDRVGNQFRSTTTNVGTDGQQWSGLFSFDLTELSTYLLSNPGFTVSESSFFLTRAGGASNSTTINLYQTEAFAGSATWLTSDGSSAWNTPLTANTGGVAGGGTILSNSLGGGTVSTANSVMSFTSSTSFVDSVNDALARGDKTLYLVLQAATYSSFDSYAIFTNNTGSVDSRPELTITVIPEPSTALLGAFGVLALLRRRR